MAHKPISSLKSLLSEVGTPDRLMLIERLGFGGQAEVWLARDQMLGRLVTVKKVRAFITPEEREEDERLHSLRARAEMEHPAIPTLFGVIPNGDQSWLISEYVEGIALSELLGELSPESIYAVAKDLLSALRCLERLSLVHGDLSPNNIVIDRNGQVRLVDFESCSRIGEALSSTSTIGFSAPERHARRVGLPTVDTWSVGAVLIWLVTQRTPEIVLDDAKKPISVAIGSAIPATDLLGDVINIAAAATRLDPSLRPLTADLEERLSLSYRWLEPVNRSALESLVTRRLLSASHSNERPPVHLASASPLNENLESKLDPKSNGRPEHAAPSRKDQGLSKRAWFGDGLQEQRDAGWSGWGSTGWFDAKWFDDIWRGESRFKREVDTASDARPCNDGKRIAGRPSQDKWFSGGRFLVATYLLLFLSSLGLAGVASLFVSSLNWWQQPYSVRVDTTRLSPATALPNEFSPQWVESIFSSAMPDNWELVSIAEAFQRAVPATEHSDRHRADSELLARAGSGDIAGRDESLNVEAGGNTQVHPVNDAVVEVIISINCAQGICELLAESEPGGIPTLDHTVILDTNDRRVWRAAITKLAQSIAID